MFFFRTSSGSPEGHQNPISGSKVMAIVLKGWIFPIGGALAVEGRQSTGLPCLVFCIFILINIFSYAS